MSGPPPKPASLRQRTNKKAGSAQLVAFDPSLKVPPIPNPDGRVWHPLTLNAWKHAWQSPMAAQWLETDVDGLGQLALLWDEFYSVPDAKILAEIRLQRQCFGLTPLDRSRLQWEVIRAEDAEQRRPRRPVGRSSTADPRKLLMAVK